MSHTGISKSNAYVFQLSRNNIPSLKAEPKQNILKDTRRRGDGGVKSKSDSILRLQKVELLLLLTTMATRRTIELPLTTTQQNKGRILLFQFSSNFNTMGLHDPSVECAESSCTRNKSRGEYQLHLNRQSSPAVAERPPGG